MDEKEQETPAENLSESSSEESTQSAESQTDWRQVILDYLAQDGYHPVKPRVIVKKLRVPQEDVRDFKKALKKLIKKNEVHYGPRHYVKPGPKQSGKKDDQSAVEASGSRKKGKDSGIVGVFRRAAAGYGFVRPQHVVGGDRSEDIFVPASQTRDASQGDVVRVVLSKKKDAKGSKDSEKERKTRGRIVEIIERETNQFVGTYQERMGDGFVKLDGTQFNDPIYVGDPGAKNAATGDKVVIEMVRFPTPKHAGEGVVVEVLGAKGEPGVDTLGVIRQFGLPDEFPEEVLADARNQAAAFNEEDLGGRRDLTADTIITIDPVDARDFDDAISLEKLENGHWLLGVHIADVAHFVPPGSVLDREAKARATSIYLPDRVIPMLPEIISNNLASLQPNRVRYAKSVFMEMTAEGTPVSAEVQSTAIKSKHRFAYEEVDDYLADHKKWENKLAPEVHALVGRMHELAMTMRQRRLERGSIELILPEVKIDLNKDGEVSGAHVVQNTESHQVIEEFMLAANVAVATWLTDKKLAFLRRVHESPDTRKLKELTAFVRDLGFQTEGMESRFEIKRILEEAANQPARHAIHYSVLKSMKKAVYSPEEEGHYALNFDNYTHFTSPIRRYPDLTIHRMFDALEAGKRPKTSMDELLTLGDHCSEMEQRAEKAERELTKIKLLTYLSKQIGTQMDGVITGVEEYGLFVQCQPIPAEGMIHISALSDDYYTYESASHSLVGRRGGRYQLGGLVRVEILRVDIGRRELDLRIVGK
jgi:ribonuclease R